MSAAPFPQVRPYGTGPRARFPYGVRRDAVSGTLEDQLRASIDIAERESLVVQMTHLASLLAGYADRHPEATRALDLLDEACDALREATP